MVTQTQKITDLKRLSTYTELDTDDNRAIKELISDLSYIRGSRKLSARDKAYLCGESDYY